MYDSPSKKRIGGISLLTRIRASVSGMFRLPRIIQSARDMSLMKMEDGYIVFEMLPSGVHVAHGRSGGAGDVVEALKSPLEYIFPTKKAAQLVFNRRLTEREQEERNLNE